MMEKMSSVDTPLGTLNKLQRKTKDLATPYVVLSGNKALRVPWVEDPIVLKSRKNLPSAENK